jgi:hypothetical protein
VLAESEETVALMRERLLSAVGQHGQLLVYVIPSLELLIGEQPAVALDLGISELQSLYTQLFTRLVDVFSRCLPPFFTWSLVIIVAHFAFACVVWCGGGCSAKPDHPLVMFLDDLHWADQPSFHLLTKIVRSCSPRLILSRSKMLTSNMCADVPHAIGQRRAAVAGGRVSGQRSDERGASAVAVSR